jgi:hypothetical protein
MKTFFRLQAAVTLVFLLCTFLAFGSCAQNSRVIPAISFANPPSTAYVHGDVTVSVSVSNFNLIDNQNQPAIQGEGQVLYVLDGDTPTNLNLTAEPSPVTRAITRSETYTFHNVSTGAHTVSVELVNNNLTELNPPVALSMTVFVFPLPVTSGPTSDLTTAKHQTVDPTQPITRRETGLIV